MSDSLWLHGLPHTRLLCPPLSPGICSGSCQWCHPTISSCVVPFSFCLQSFPASGSLPMSQFFTSGAQSIGASASISVLPMNIQGWFPLGLTGLIFLLSKGLSRAFSSAIFGKHQFFWCSAFSCRKGSGWCVLASSVDRRWNFLAPGPPSRGVQWTMEVSCAHCSGTWWWNSYGWLPTRGGGLQAQLPTEPLGKAKACPRGSVPAITGSSRQRDVALWRGPNLLFQDVCQSSLERETILCVMIIHFDYTSAPGKYGTFFFFLQCLGTKQLWVLVSAHQKSVLWYNYICEADGSSLSTWLKLLQGEATDLRAGREVGVGLKSTSLFPEKSCLVCVSDVLFCFVLWG